MATDYDAPRKTDEELAEDSLEELKARRVDKAASTVDVDEAELAETLELPGADFSLLSTAIAKESGNVRLDDRTLTGSVDYRVQLSDDGSTTRVEARGFRTFTEVVAGVASALYIGEVVHQRSRTFDHRLRYRLWMVLVDLDELDGLQSRLRLLGRGRCAAAVCAGCTGAGPGRRALPARRCRYRPG